jgi:hypothetical protein
MRLAGRPSRGCSFVTRALGVAYPDRVAAVHLTQLIDASATAETADPSSEADQRSLEAAYRYEYELGGYAAIQTTRPQLMAYARYTRASPVALTGRSVGTEEQERSASLLFLDERASRTLRSMLARHRAKTLPGGCIENAA